MTEQKHIAVIGASGAIGGAFVDALAAREGHYIHAFSRRGGGATAPNITHATLDLTDEASIAAAAAGIATPLDMVLVATGLLHDDQHQPEKSLRDLSAEKFARAFAINSTGVALVMQHFLPRLPRERRAVFAAISARVGSISDNRLGGWYAYRASKAALNMLIRCAAIETARRHPQAVVVGLHPGTVDSPLSQPFQAQVREGKLFTPEHSATQLLAVLEGLSAEDSGKCFAYDGSEVLP